MELSEHFKKNWKKIYHHTNGKTLLLAVSGGIDSMVMTELFLQSKIPFAIAHCNFQLRETDAVLDEELVTSFAKKNKIPFHIIHFNTKAKMQEWKKPVQETARILRYEWLEQIRTENDYSMIATAHHANDNAETLLLNLFKGTGISGMHGIPVVNNKIIRPLLFVKKQDLIEYATVNKIDYREDISNATDAYKRNEIRHHIIPAIEKIFPDAVKQISESIDRLKEAEIIYKTAVANIIKKLVEPRGQDFYISVLTLKKTVPLNTVCYEVFSKYGFSPAQIPQIIQLLDSESGHYTASETHRIIRNRNFLIITSAVHEGAETILIEAVPAAVNAKHFLFQLSINQNSGKISQEPQIACVDAKKMEFPLLLRKWKTGDYFYPLGMGMKKKKLSRFFIDQKIPLHEKENIWVLESKQRIVWVCGYRLDERFKIKETTENILEIKISPKRQN